MATATATKRSPATATLTVLAILLVLSAEESAADNFLVIHPLYSGSHVLTMHTVVENLVKRGHQVTTLRIAESRDLKLKPLGPNHTDTVLYLNNTDKSIPMVSDGERGHFVFPGELFWKHGTATFKLFYYLGLKPYYMFHGFCDRLLGDQQLIDDLRDQEFNVAFVDLLYNECGLALAHHLGLPSVAYWAYCLTSGEIEFSQASLPPAYNPHFSTGIEDRMNPWERVVNTFFKVLNRVYAMIHVHLTDIHIQRNLPDSPGGKALLANLSGALINSNPILEHPILQPTSFINIGGLQITKEVGKLPRDVQKFLDGAKDGAILFAMGYIFDTRAMPDDFVPSLFEMFSRLPYRVIMKLDDDQVRQAKRPPNVMIKNYVDQQAVLAHNNTQLFFFHFGGHGIYEAIWHKVPMVGIPIFTDSRDRMAYVIKKEIGLGLYKEATVDQIRDAILAVTTNKKYKENVSRLSEMMHKQRQHPMDEAIWLMEYVSRTKGAEHMKLGSRKLNFIQYYSLDVIGLLATIAIIAYVASSHLALKIMAFRRSRKEKTD